MKQRLHNYNSKNQVYMDSIDPSHLNDKIAHRNHRLNFLHSQLGIGRGALQKTIDHEKKLILDKSKKLTKLDEYLINEKECATSIKSVPQTKGEIDQIIESKVVPFKVQKQMYKEGRHNDQTKAMMMRQSTLDGAMTDQYPRP
jgi:regulator of replication initiation timing